MKMESCHFRSKIAEKLSYDSVSFEIVNWISNKSWNVTEATNWASQWKIEKLGHTVTELLRNKLRVWVIEQLS